MQGPDRAIRIVTSNKMPAVVDLDLVPDPESSLGVPPGVIARRARQIAADGQFAGRVGKALARRYPPWPTAAVVEARMYEGFPSRADERRMAAFHGASGPERAELVKGFEDDRLRELGRRLVFYENPEALDPQRHDMLATWLGNRRHGRDGVAAGRTLGAAKEEVEQAAADMPDRAAEVKAIWRWLEGEGGVCGGR